ncbi:NADbinding domain 4 domain containing protein [Acanthamoeba castellanii str. Neff]|uniref:NADbinding domain 4 domain containing protein n=1 Tax=Acanthamoeba castellanii (strain ATCC 30010 / Neff) TaxID=1257118 RepID=L8HH72_ACACF|nr:NADbinding domain 4 domain containing protein [Acanthamoeba castellanii str. Neff]ELR24552.1 NADbinding domain 4 domain containing protein [Acanthamoeba castellanii str. Neff]
MEGPGAPILDWPIQRLPGVVFITGVTGFLGKILLEKMLRDLPGVSKYFVLIRPKKDCSAEERFQKEVLSSPLFNPLRKALGGDRAFAELVKDKVEVLKGDILDEDLGLSAEEMKKVVEEVTVFIHCAATISFTEPLLDAINQNVVAALRVLKIAKSAKRVKIFTHVSTAYVGCNRTGFIEEKAYPFPFEPEQLLNRLLTMHPKDVEKQTKKLLGRYPNTYTFTKSLAEHMFLKKRGNLPLAICRPAIINAVNRDPVPGWIDTLAAAGGLYAACGFGILKFLPGHLENATDQVPADFVVNCIIAATAYNAGKDRYAIYHSGTSHRNPLRWSHIVKCLLPYWLMNPPKRMLGRPSFQFISGPYPMYEITYFLKWTVPAMIYQLLARTVGDKKVRKNAKMLDQIDKRLTKFTETFRHFTENVWIFAVDNSDELLQSMTPDEKEVFNFDASKLDWEDYLMRYAYGLRTYALNEKGLRPPKKGDYLVYSGLSLTRKPFADIMFAMKSNLIVNNAGISRTGEQLKLLVLSSPRVQRAIAREVSTKQVSIQVAESRAKNILEVMGAEASPAVLRSLAWAFRKIYRRLYSGVVINQVGLEAVKELFGTTLKKEKSAVVLIPSHRSYIDFLIVSYIFYSFQLPVPHIAAGDDFLNMLLVRWIFRHSGAFFMRRSLGEDELYREIFTEYTQRLLLDGYPVEFFIEGTRSRSGKMIQPKMGLLSIITDPFFEEMLKPNRSTRNAGSAKKQTLEDVHFVPIGVSYEKVVEESQHVKELMGESKQKPSLRALLAAAHWFGNPISLRSFMSQEVATNPDKRALGPHGDCPPLPFDIYSLPGLPTAVPAKVDAAGPSPSESQVAVRPEAEPYNPWTNKNHRRIAINNLAFKICQEIEANIVSMSTGIVAALVLTQRNGIKVEDLIEKFSWLKELIIAKGGWNDPILHPVNYVVTRAIRLLQPLIIERNRRLEPNYITIQDQRNWVHLGYYRNQIVHLFKDECIMAVALYSFGRSTVIGDAGAGQVGVRKDELFARIAFLCSLLKFEFIPTGKEDYEQLLGWFIEKGLFQSKTSADHQHSLIFVPPHGERYFTFLCLLFWPFIDSYWLASLALFSALHDRTVQGTTLIDNAQWFADHLFKSGVLQHFDANSKDTFHNAFTVFKHWGILKARGERYTSGREVLLHLSPYWQEEKALDALVHHIGSFRREPLRQGVLDRKALLADFPVVARL